MCEMQTYCWVVDLVGRRGTRVVELACWGQNRIWYESSFFFVFAHGFYLKQTFSTFWFCQGLFDLSPLCQFLSFRKETAVKMWQDLQTHLKSCLPSSLTSISRPILSWMLMPVISSFTKMQIFQKCQYVDLQSLLIDDNSSLKSYCHRCFVTGRTNKVQILLVLFLEYGN